MTDPAKHIWSACSGCSRETRHEILHSVQVTHNDDYRCSSIYMIIRCCGCLGTSFREDFEDFESGHHDENGVFVYPTTTTSYPKVTLDHKKLHHLWHLPQIVYTVYNQVIIAINEDARVLAGLGLRLIVETICIDRNVKGNNLEKKISALETQGLISKTDRDRLHAIRFLGNDAAHEAKEPSREKLLIAIQIIEHLLSAMYIMEYDIENHLEVVVSDYNGFINLLTKKINTRASGDEISLAALFDKELRRINDNITHYETELIKDINSGVFDKLKLGKAAMVGNPAKSLQFYIVS